jgi:hypothetical protein
MTQPTPKRTCLTHKALKSLSMQELIESKEMIDEGWFYDPDPTDIYASNDEILEAFLEMKLDVLS